MKKTITLFAGLLVAISVTFAQEEEQFSFYYNGTQLENNAEITISETTPVYPGSPSLLIESHIELESSYNSTVSATCNQVVLEADGGRLNFCFVLCAPAGLKDETQTGEVNPGMHEGFHVNYELPDFGGKAKVRYEIYPENDPDNMQVLIVNYDPNPDPNKLNNNQSNGTFNVYQSGNGVTFDYNLNVSGNFDLYIYNATGMVVGQYPLNSTQGSLTLPESLNRGVYIAAIKQGNNSVSLQKFMVK